MTTQNYLNVSHEFESLRWTNDSREIFVDVEVVYGGDEIFWFVAKFPNSEYDGPYLFSTSIDKIADKNNWKVRWVGGPFSENHNPWKK